MMHPNDLLTTLELDWVGHDCSLQNFTQVLRKKQQLNRVVFDDDAIVCNEKRIVCQDRLGTNATQNRTVKRRRDQKCAFCFLSFLPPAGDQWPGVSGLRE
jgi:hypothetical protein